MKKTIFLDLDGVIHQSKSVDEYNDPHVFSRVELYPHAQEFIYALQQLGNVMVISKTFVPLEDERHIQQQRDKLRKCKELGFSNEEILILPSNIDKNIFCHRGDILIDDYSYNCKKWEEFGGVAIQFNEHKRKPHLTARGYDGVLQLIRKMR